MYQNAFTREEDPRALLSLMRLYPLATITGRGPDGWASAQIPLLAHIRKDGSWKLEGHVHREADHRQAWIRSPEVLVQFHGPQAYISSSWYRSPGRAATWNFIQIQGEGTMHFLDKEGTRALLERQVRFFESGQQNPGSLEDLSAEYLKAHLPLIEGIEIHGKSFRTCFKLSRNESPEDIARIIAHLRKSSRHSDREMADWMERYPKKMDRDQRDWSEWA